MLFSGDLLSSPFDRQYQYDVNGGVFPLTFYSVMLPLILKAGLILLPSLWGMHQGRRPATCPLVQTLLWVAAIATALATRSWFWWPLQIGYHADVLWARWLIQVLLVAVYWPFGYMLVTTSWRRLRGKTV